MDRGDAGAEIVFAAKIDSRFPYRDQASASALIEEGRAVSLEASFGVLHEICRKGKSDRVTRKRQHELVEQWATGFEHDLKDPLLQCAHALIEKQHLSCEETMGLMEQIGHFEGQYAALNIAYFAGDCDSNESASQLEATHERICHLWSEKSAPTNGGSPKASI